MKYGFVIPFGDPGLVVDHAPGEPLRVTAVIAAGVRVL